MSQPILTHPHKHTHCGKCGMDMGVWLCNQTAEQQRQPTWLSHMKSILTLSDHCRARGQLADDHMRSRSSLPAQEGSFKPRTEVYLKTVCLTATFQAVDSDYIDGFVFSQVATVCIRAPDKMKLLWSENSVALVCTSCTQISQGIFSCLVSVNLFLR